MTASQLVQFYAPFGGLLVVVFWLGVLSQTVKDLKNDVIKLMDQTDDGSMSERMVRIETLMGGVQTSMEKLDRNMQGVQRQLGNIASDRHEFRKGEHP